MHFEQWSALFSACVALSLSPGPNSTLALSTAIRHGHRAALLAVAGGALGFSSLILIALCGATAFMASLPLALEAIKWSGGLYLILLAYKLVNSHKVAKVEEDSAPKPPFLSGAIIAFSNPKIVLFWLAFIPSLLPIETLSTGGILLIVATFTMVEACAECVLVWLGQSAQRFLQQHIVWVNRMSAAIFLIFAVVILFN